MDGDDEEDDDVVVMIMMIMMMEMVCMMMMMMMMMMDEAKLTYSILMRKSTSKVGESHRITLINNIKKYSVVNMNELWRNRFEFNRKNLTKSVHDNWCDDSLIFYIKK
jgi:hypothetical protein